VLKLGEGDGTSACTGETDGRDAGAKVCCVEVEALGGTGDGEREAASSEARAGLPIDLRTVSSVRSIFLNERARTSCFLADKHD
jgi:hypothetical protein